MRPRAWLNQLLAELGRRRVFRVVAGYAVAAWIVIQVAATVFPLLDFPAWSARIVVVAALGGFPVVIALAWTFDITEQGIGRTPDAASLEHPNVPVSLRIRYALLLVVVLVVAASGWFAWRRTGASVNVSPDAVAVLPFSIKGSSQFGYLSAGMVDLLSTKLDGAGRMHSVDPRAVLSMLKQQGSTYSDLEDASSVASRLGAGLFVLGDIIEVGGKLHIEAKLYERSNIAQPIVNASAEGPAATVFELVDSLTAKLIRPRASPAEARLTRLSDVTTTSLNALKSFLQGEQFSRIGHFNEAIDAYRRAVQQDTTFALAYYRLSIAAEWAIRPDLATQAAERAYELRSSRLSEHDRRLLETLRVWRNGDGETAERQYRGILDTYPNDIEAWTQLGEVLFHWGPLRGRSLRLSREAWEHLLYVEPDNISAIFHLGRVAALEGKRIEVDSLVRNGQRIASGSERAAELAPLRAAALGDAHEKQAALDALNKERDNNVFIAVWSTVLMTHDLAYGRELAAKLTAPQRAASVRAVGHVMMAHLDLTQGRLKSARQELEEAGHLDRAAGIEYKAFFATLPFIPTRDADLRDARSALIAWDPRGTPPSGSVIGFFNAHDELHPALRLYLAGILSGRLLDHSATVRYATGLEKVTPPASLVGTLVPDLAHAVRAQPFISAGHVREAFAELDKAQMKVWYEHALASPFHSQAYTRYERAELLHALGRDDEALQWYNSFAENQTFDLIFEPPALLRRAEIFAKRGDRARAKQYYQQFIKLWENCDRDLKPVVDSARARLAQL
jgi:tetratricopeptide (TPR) repeat protein